MAIIAWFILAYFIVGFLCACHFMYLTLKEEGTIEYDDFIISIKLTLLGFISIALMYLVWFPDNEDY